MGICEYWPGSSNCLRATPIVRMRAYVSNPSHSHPTLEANSVVHCVRLSARYQGVEVFSSTSVITFPICTAMANCHAQRVKLCQLLGRAGQRPFDSGQHSCGSLGAIPQP